VLGTIAATVTKADLMNVLPSPAIISHAITAGYGTAFVSASAIALASVLIAIVAITGRRGATTMETIPEAA
jgi:hypothetical protein